MKWALYEQLRAATAAGASVALVTRLADGEQSLCDGSSCRGALTLSAEAQASVQRMLVAGRSGVLPGAENLFVRAYARAPRLIVVGAAHISQFLAPMATLAGFDVTVIDPRKSFASPSRFEGVKLIDAWPDEALQELKLDATSAIVTLTHAGMPSPSSSRHTASSSDSDGIVSIAITSGPAAARVCSRGRCQSRSCDVPRS